MKKNDTQKVKPKEIRGVELNRLDIAQVPIKEAQYFWNNAKVRQNSTDNISLIIKVGLFYQNQVSELGMIFKYHSPDLIYCQPTENSFIIDSLLKFANNLKINFLYPMSSIGDKEYIFQEDAIRTQIGIGQTANVLRNICYHLYEKNKNGWIELTKLMKTLFSVELKNPSFAEQEYKIQRLDGIFLSEKMKKLEILIHNELIESVIQDKTILGLYKKASQEEREALFVSQTENKKMSSILETTLEIFAKQEGERILLTKGNFYKLIGFLDKLPQEVEEKLDYLKKYLEF